MSLIEGLTIEVEKITSWERALKAARRTGGKKPLGKDPSLTWRKKVLIAEHSPIRLVEYDIYITNIPMWVTVHLIRHWLGFIPFVHSQRDDRRDNGCPRGKLLQDSPNDMMASANAQALINISKVRLCGCASPETREVWTKLKAAMNKVDPEMAAVMVPSCIYRGFCPEMECCGYCDTPGFTKALEEYRKLNKAQGK